MPAGNFYTSYYSGFIFKLVFIFLALAIPGSMPDVLAKKTAIPINGSSSGIHQCAIDA